jgi:hypothetical protein
LPAAAGVSAQRIALDLSLGSIDSIRAKAKHTGPIFGTGYKTPIKKRGARCSPFFSSSDLYTLLNPYDQKPRNDFSLSAASVGVRRSKLMYVALQIHG